MTLTYALAWVLPWLTGTGICVALNRGLRSRGDLAAAAGAGFIVGLVVVALIASMIAGAETTRAFARVAPWLSAVGVLAWVAAFAMRGRHELRIDTGWAPGWRLLWWLLVAGILLRLGMLGSEALLRPTFPWDAWSAWAVKPKTWFLLDQHVAYVPTADWLAQSALPQRTSAVWEYPELLAWIQVWFASAAGSWNEPFINIVWTGVLGAIALASYGQWRVLGLRPMFAMVLTYALVSLPLLGAHVALAGYADLWLAAVFGLVTLSWVRWIRRREPGQLALAIALALCMPYIKLEGAVWLLLFSLVFLFGLLPRRWRWIAIAIATLLAAIGFVFGGFVFPMLGLGWVSVSWGRIGIPALGSLDLHWRPVGTQMLSGLLTLPNWHLLWYLVPAVLVWRWQVLVADRAARSLAMLLACCAVFLFVLFFFTEASAWAENYTSANRLILHLVPAVFSLLGLLLARAFPGSEDTAPARHVPIARA